jgi:mannose-6-phosphate isomerase-like protein (cupin superfamily)
MELIDNTQVRKFHFQENFQQTLAGPDQGLKTFEVWRLSLPPGNEIPPVTYPGEVAAITLQGTGRIVVDGQQADIRPDTTLVILAGATSQILNTGLNELVILLVRAQVPA